MNDIDIHGLRKFIILHVKLILVSVFYDAKISMSPHSTGINFLCNISVAALS